MRPRMFEKHIFEYFCRIKYISLLVDNSNQSENLQKDLSSYIAPKF